mmetsp:Transcript_22566/g.66815  ORF Transcript_22566/g.66815 Transcript_22566/m.66815 type:complete len:96 (-) Transcript_22566:286-573(-)
MWLATTGSRIPQARGFYVPFSAARTPVSSTSEHCACSTSTSEILASSETHIRRLLDRLLPSVSLRPVRDNEWRGFSRTAAALRWSEDWYVDRISP